MKYPRFDELPALIEKKLITKRPHPSLPLSIYNYSPSAQYSPMSEWTEAMRDCRGLILDDTGEIVGRPFRKFWNMDQVLDQIPMESFTVWEKLDGSLGIVCYYAGERVCATRGSFESDQAKWLVRFMDHKHESFYPDGTTYLFEIVFPSNRIVVDYGDTEDAFLLSVMADDATDLWHVFNNCDRFRKARRFDGISDFAAIDENPQFAGQEGFVVQWDNGFRAKLKLAEYKRLHRLITQCSTRTIWEMLRAGSDTQELLDRVPKEFDVWVRQQIYSLNDDFERVTLAAMRAFSETPGKFESRKDFAMWAKQQPNPQLLFSLLDGKDITDAGWKLAEPKWETPFKMEAE